MVIKAHELAAQHDWFLPRQFENEANAWMHEQTTGPEIMEAFGRVDIPLDHFFTSYGTGGTLQGVGRYLRKHSPHTTVHVTEPDNAPLLYSQVETPYNESGQFTECHPVWRPHLLQGWAPDFIPKLVHTAVQERLFDHVTHIGGQQAMDTSRELARKEGILTGTSGGGCLASALNFANSTTLAHGTNILAMLPDTGERYLSTPL